MMSVFPNSCTTVSCAAVNCRNTKSSSSRVIFFRFPKDATRCTSWAYIARRNDIVHHNVEDLHKNYYICSEHFEDSQFINFRRNSLIWNAMPTIFDISSLGKGSTEQESVNASKKCTSSKTLKENTPVLVRLQRKEYDPLPHEIVPCETETLHTSETVPVRRRRKEYDPLPDEIAPCETETFLTSETATTSSTLRITNGKNSSVMPKQHPKSTAKLPSAINLQTTGLSVPVRRRRKEYDPLPDEIAPCETETDSLSSSDSPLPQVNQIRVPVTAVMTSRMQNTEDHSYPAGLPLSEMMNCTCSCQSCRSAVRTREVNSDLRKRLNSAQRKVRRLEKNVAKLRSEKKAARVNATSTFKQLIEEFKNHVSDNAREIVFAQVRYPDNIRNPHQWSSDVKNVFLTLYRDSFRGYKMLSKYLDLPRKSSLLNHERELRALLLSERELGLLAFPFEEESLMCAENNIEESQSKLLPEENCPIENLEDIAGSSIEESQSKLLPEENGPIENLEDIAGSSVHL